MTETKTYASLAEATAALQGMLPKIGKAETARVTSDKGSYSYSYATLDQISAAILPLLSTLGLSFIAKPTLNADGKFVLAYKLKHTSDQEEVGEYPLPTSGTPQQVGSAITYARRYCLTAVTGVSPADEDDDGKAAEDGHAAAVEQANAERERQRRETMQAAANRARDKSVLPDTTWEQLQAIYNKVATDGLYNFVVKNENNDDERLHELVKRFMEERKPVQAVAS